jgi:hypothetical protein
MSRERWAMPCYQWSFEGRGAVCWLPCPSRTSSSHLIVVMEPVEDRDGDDLCSVIADRA